jgi:uncharacterized protein YecT (DUF1311 family)
MRDRSFLKFATISVIGVAVLISIAQIYAQTQASMNAQARADFARADADLNKTYQSLLANLRNAKSKQKLKESQRAWIASRDAAAARAADEARGGSMAPTIRYQAMTQLTRERTNQLKNSLRGDTTLDQKGTATSSPQPQKSPATNTVTETTAESSSTASPGQEDGANETCDCPPSPDGKFGFLASNTEDSYIIDLIDKKSGKKLQRIDEAEVPVFWNVLWAPDSNGFALKTKVEGHPRLQGVDVYFRSGETFQKIELPDLPKDNIGTGVVWAPDSKRIAFNFYLYNPGRVYASVAFYELRDAKWVALLSPVDEASEYTQLAQLARKYSPKNTYQKPDPSLVSDRLEARSWTDANTLLLDAYWEGDEEEAAARFTLKFDKTENGKIVKMQRLSKKQLEQEQ